MDKRLQDRPIIAAQRPVPPSIATASAIETVEIEREALAELGCHLARADIGESFDRVARLVLAAKGRVGVSGMGKSGLIARKIAATLSSTGTPALFIHPADAGHGDLGMVTADDVMIVLSWSGETTELSDIIGYCRRFSVPLIAITTADRSTLARQSDHVLVLPTVREACPNRLAPTSSTIMQLALGDALAVALITLRGFSPQDFRVFHPKGQLAAQLMNVCDLMSRGSAIPIVGDGASILTATVEMSLKRLGVTAIVDADDRLLGAFTDGDLRRSLAQGDLSAPVLDHCSTTPLTIAPSALASEALALMNRRNILQLFVVDDERLIGVVHLHDVLRVGVV